jgi:high affinity sulfate transporter 1
MVSVSLRSLPGVQVITNYRAGWLRRDVVGGVVVSTLLVPQGMAYAELAGLPVITGLYTTIFCLIGYAIFGPSKVLVIGPDSTLGPMIAVTLAATVGAEASSDDAVATASFLALLVAAILIALGLLRFGFIADLLSKPTQIGYLNGLALTILVGQLPKLFGFSIEAEGLIAETKDFVDGVADGDTVGAAVVIGVISLGLIVGLKRWLPAMPGVLIAVVASIVAVSVFDLSGHGVDLVGKLPEGLPAPALPRPSSASDLPILAASACAIALVALTDTISTASVFAARANAELDGDAEMKGIGAGAFLASFFQGFPASTSGSRTAVEEQAGARTQVANVVGATMIIAMLLFVPGLLRNLPQPTLAAIVIAASMSLTDIGGAVRLWHQQRSEFAVAMIAFAGVALVGVVQGLAVAIALSVMIMFKRSWQPYFTTLGRVTGLAGYHDKRQYPAATEFPGLVIFRFDAPLFFANARTFRDQVRGVTKGDPGPRWVVVAAASITDIDTTAATILSELREALERGGTTLVFAALKDPVREKLDRYLGADWFRSMPSYPTVGTAVQAFGGENGSSPQRNDAPENYDSALPD